MSDAIMDSVWVRDAEEGFVLGKIGEWYSDGWEVTPVDRKHPKRIYPFDDIYRAGDYSKQYDDNCEMMFLNEATLLNNIKKRYYSNKIYTFVANILIAVNPYREIADLYSLDTIRQYQGRSLGEMPPHVFSIADKALRDLRVLRKSQSIIVSGESGAGKTESTKHLLRYLCESWGAKAGPVERKILDANPVLEAFGNAKTTRNNNSSRFGKFIEVHFDQRFQVVGGHISHYLLEKSRICSPSTDERSYHVFYRLMAGAPDSLRTALHVTQPDDFNYLRTGCTQYFSNAATDKKISQSQNSRQTTAKGSLQDTLLNDYEDFQRLHDALGRIGLSDSERVQIYAIVAAVLHLGNIEFEDNPEDTRGGCTLATRSEKSLLIASKLLAIDSHGLKQALVSRVMQSARGGLKGTVIMVPLKVHEARNARDALAKALYSKLFDYIVACINKSIPFQASSYYVGVLDIAGFEFFTVNSFEQFCINYCNEKLQEFFNETILKFEQELYRREGLNVPEIKFVDNQDCIDIIEAKTRGIFNLLDEESKLPKPNFTHFTAEVHAQWPNHFRLALPRCSRLKAHRQIRDDEGFVIRHFAGAVCYQTNQFMEKNNDALHASLESIVQESSAPFIKSLFATSESQRGKLSFISVGSKFKSQLADLMEKLRDNGTNFIRCVKPNSRMVHQQFDGALSLMQLKCSGMASVLELMEHGYPSRTPFAELYATYEQFLPKELKMLSPKKFCEAMLHSLNLHTSDYKFGITRVFFRPGTFSEFDRIMRSEPENLKSIIVKVKKWLVRSRWIQSQFAALTVIKLKNKIIYRRRALIIMQKTVRGHLARKKHAPRISAIRKLTGVHNKVRQLEEIGSQLKNREDSMRQINSLKNDIKQSINAIKSDPNSALAADAVYNQLLEKVNRQMVTLEKKVQEQKNRDEQERLRTIQEQIERERQRKEEEERKLSEEEANRKQKVEMEARRKKEEEARRVQEEQDRQTALDLQRQQEVNDRRYQEQLEQERQDHELAVRLAAETNEHLEDSPPMLRNDVLDPNRNIHRFVRSEAVRNHQNAMSKGKYDLSRWKYSELRDTINTSCDIELLEACRHEFHRRLKVYHAWKAKKGKRTTMDENERAPRSVLEAAQKTPRFQQKPIAAGDRQRYFKIPFTRPPTIKNESTEEQQVKKGWWYAHFDGEYVARQLELHADKSAVRLVAGIDDMQMCELSLTETGLTRRRGAEILESEFNREWKKHGGEDYIRPAERKQ